MAAITGTSVNNALSNGYLTADGFLGAPSTTDTNNQRLSTQPAQFPNGGTFTGAITANGGIVNGGGTSSTVTTVAAAGATQGTAAAIPATAVIVKVTTTTSTEGVQLPTAATGKTVTILPPTTIGIKVYGKAAGQLINANTTATTAYAITSGTPIAFYGVDATHWRVQGNTSSSLAGTLAVTGATTLSGLTTSTGGMTVSGAQKEVISIVAAAGATQGTAAAIPAGAVLVNVTATTSSEGVKLPTVATGRVITLLTPTTKGFKVYTAAAGQVINANTTATTAFAVTTNKPATFYGIDTSHWRALRGN